MDTSLEQALKRCSKCGLEIDRSQFRRNFSTKDGLQFWCKTCHTNAQRLYKKTPEGRRHQRMAQENYLKTPRGKESQRKSQNKFNKTARGKLIRIKVRARARGLSATISADDFEKWWKDSPHICGYCGCTTNEYRQTVKNLRQYSGKRRTLRLLRTKLLKLEATSDYDLTVDRADNELGYEFGNLTKACWICNVVKGHLLTSAEMRITGRRIRKEIEDGLAEVEV